MVEEEEEGTMMPHIWICYQPRHLLERWVMVAQPRHLLEHWVLVPQPRHLLEHLVLVPLRHKLATTKMTTMCLPCKLQNNSSLKDSCFRSPVWYANRWEEEDVEAYLQPLFDHKNVPF